MVLGTFSFKGKYFFLFFVASLKRDLCQATGSSFCCSEIIIAATQPLTVECKMEAQLEHVHVSARLVPICMLNRHLLTKLLTKFLHRSSAGSLLTVSCRLGTCNVVPKSRNKALAQFPDVRGLLRSSSPLLLLHLRSSPSSAPLPPPPPRIPDSFEGFPICK